MTFTLGQYSQRINTLETTIGGLNTTLKDMQHEIGELRKTTIQLAAAIPVQRA